jgi:hypothetical protein
MKTKTIGYIVVDRENSALLLDAKDKNHFWLMGDEITVFSTYREAWNAVKRFRRWLRNEPGLLNPKIKANLIQCRPLKLVAGQ